MNQNEIDYGDAWLTAEYCRALEAEYRDRGFRPEAFKPVGPDEFEVLFRDGTVRRYHVVASDFETVNTRTLRYHGGPWYHELSLPAPARHIELKFTHVPWVPETST